jgi:hypothetical protein
MRDIGVVVLLGAAGVLWSAAPLGGTGWPGGLFVVLASACVVAGALRLVRRGTARPDKALFAGALVRLADGADALLEGLGWETAATVAVVGLETLHKSRPWHTGLLGVVLVCYLLAVHRAESVVPSAVLRGQARLLSASAGLLVVVTGVAMVPSVRTGALSGWLEVLAALAAMVAGGLALPV